MTIAGKRILIVEDEFIVAAMLGDILEDEGAVLLGPAGTLAEGLALAGGEALDAAVLDWNLGGEPGAPIARALRERGVPFVIATGYGVVQDEFSGVTVLSKPYQPGALVAELARLTGG
ncbi:response regulator [Novosphingobium sp. KCTC 2891]|uniref:response regulator n=1 Tax=Novosphingobium sp. KCTC 2891 TaxID=2989730 RepID=UPI002223BC49|nr:response regulator [Novosphingobium sp. KCTC 2891]MCW1382814.1 response regulator [Novosphingobium sp. KCTC 2891]